MPVHGSSLVEIVCDFDLDPITLRLLDTDCTRVESFPYPVSFNQWSWELAIDYKERKLNTIWSHCLVGDHPLVVTSHASIGHILLIVGIGVILLSQTPRTTLRHGSIYPWAEARMIEQTPWTQT